MTDKVIKFLAYNGKVSVICCDTKELIEYTRNLHDLTPTTTAAMGRFLTISAMMAHNEIKEESDNITIQLNGRGPVGSMVSVARLKGKEAIVKGYIQDPSIELPLKENGKIDVGGAVGKDGYLNIIKKNDITNQGYNGLVPLVSGEIAEDFASYYANSQQKPTVLALGVLVNKDGVLASGGYIINLMPDATEEEISKIEKAIENAPTISKMLEDNKSLEEIAKIVTGDENIKIIEEDLKVKYECDCFKNKFRNGIASLGKDEIQKMISEDGKANVVCHFCNKSYDFSKSDLEEILNSL